ncbi:MAG: carbohydrate-binding domain-containing protein [Ruminococcaceae bacterium]|nr:carbohydrate-binding domain-containing protein [Oscillospiraceae bacterium]
MIRNAFKICSLFLALILCFSGCYEARQSNESSGVWEGQASIEASETKIAQPDTNVTATSGGNVDSADTTITLKESTAEIVGSGAKLDGNDIVITKGGTYAVSGKLSNGRIIVYAGNVSVKVVLNGADISCNYSSAFYVKKAGKVTLTAHDGSVNILKDAKDYDYTDSYSSQSNKNPDACVYCDCDLVLNGAGKLVICGNSQNGLTGKSVLEIEKINLEVTAIGHGITGKDSLALKGTEFIVSAGKDGLRSNETANASLGTILLKESKGSITAAEDGIQAETTLKVESGSYAIQSGGGSDGVPNSQISAKGLKGGSLVTILGGTISSDSLDDAIHSNKAVEISGGNLTLKSGDDGIHADSDVNISGGNIAVNQSYEGLEATNITLSGGNIQVTASDDGVNISGGDGSGELGRPGMDRFMSSTGGKLVVLAGRLSINAEGDGLDANGDIEISGGTVIVNGSTRGGNGVLDYDGSFTVTGGILIAVGSSDMAQTPSENSSQNSLVYTNFSGGTAGSLVNIQSSDGDELITFSPLKDYNWICYSSPDIKKGESYTAYIGGGHTGKQSGGIYSGGKYTSGTKIAELTVSSAVTSNGSNKGEMGGHHGGMGRPGGLRW